MDETNAATLLDAVKRVPLQQVTDVSQLPAEQTGLADLGAPSTQTIKAPARDFVSRNQRDIPIETLLKGDVATMRGVILRERKEDQVAFLEDKYGKGNVRFADTGDPLVTIWDAERKSPVEMAVMGTGMSGTKAAAHAEALIPETLAAMAGFEAGNRIGSANRFMKFAARTIGAAVGQEVGGAAKDIAVSLEPLSEIVKNRAERIPVDAALDVGMQGVGKVAGRLLSPISGSKSEIQAGVKEARDYFRKELGVEYPLSSGEETGSTLLQRIEATMARSPGGSANFQRIQEGKLNAFRQIQSKMLSGTAPANAGGMLQRLEEDIGEDAIAAIRSKVDPIRRAETVARDAAAFETNQQIVEELAQAAGPIRQLYPEKVGGAIRAKVFAERDAWKSKMDQAYEALYQMPGGTTPILEPPNLVASAKKLLSEQPAPEITSTTPSAILGPSGQPIMVTTTGKEMLREFVPTDAVKKLQTLADLTNAKFSLRDLVKMRTEVRNDIARGEALPGVTTHYLGEIEKTLTEAIEQGAGALPDKSLRDAWVATNKEYREGVTRFKDRNVARLFKDMESGGFVQDEDIVRNIGPTEYASFKNFLGAASPEFRNLQRSILDTLVGPDQVVDGKQLVLGLDAFVRKNRAIADDILGPDRVANLKILGKLGETIKEGTLIDTADLVSVLSGPKKTGLLNAIDDLVAKQAKLTETYRSQIVKDIAEGKLGQTFNATEFVNRYYSDASPKELKAVVAQLKDNPEVLEDLRRKSVERVFSEAQRSAAAGDASRIGQGELFRPVSSGALEKAVGSEQNKERLRIILGEDGFTDFEMLGKLVRGGEAAERSFASSGGFAAQMQVHRMLTGGVLGYLSDFMKQKVGATLYASDTLRKLITNQAFRGPNGELNMARAMVASQPFLSSFEREFGPEKRDMAVNSIIDALDLYEEQGPPKQKALSKQHWVDRLLEEKSKEKPKIRPIGE